MYKNLNPAKYPRARRAKLNDSPLEEVEQRNVVTYCAYANIPCFAIPNGGKRSKTEAARMVAQGVRPGVPDLMIPRAAGKYHGLFIEMKREKGSTAPADQIAWIETLNAEGYYARVCKGFDEARETIELYMAGRL